MNFNSIKVQLELQHAKTDGRSFQRFQFHKGTIRTIYTLGLFGSYLFQFHKGTIRTRPLCNVHVQKLHFNSIKVQLEHDSVFCKVFQSLFQFHKGTIRTTSTFLSPTKTCYFNSIKVQLERTTLFLPEGLFPISIP